MCHTYSCGAMCEVTTKVLYAPCDCTHISHCQLHHSVILCKCFPVFSVLHDHVQANRRYLFTATHM